MTASLKKGQKNRAKILPQAPKAASSSSPASPTPTKPKNKPSNKQILSPSSFHFQQQQNLLSK